MDKRNSARGELRGRAARYRKYGEALRAFASRLEAPDVRSKLLLVADRFRHKAASLEAAAQRG
jgi:hypothetical protein